ncbi:YhgE/Pip domain-containing protein [Paenibacillus contaminans]|uniref:YhgE/Pip domain-containing protein n=1 Tax=Paenibacillus contaminans TaxID=450362 RepID=A0A329MFI8_9BACL|nr:YhgE/Pip domain-containing protein [Paenibacillus contaminans]RAV18705.1 YhgE/Pip domain-containing protein [Paenibacillus contaminans]
MKKIGLIYFGDMQRLTKNWVALIIIGGLVCLPSLYAWFNIKASWDPYGQTSGIAIAVTNEDRGATLRDKPVNIGDEVVASLQKNAQMGWSFVDRTKALDGVNHGDYYAAITIPADFSDKIATVLTDNPQKAEILYDVNEKINAISPKITSKGASGITEEITRNFIKTANGAIFQLFNEVGVELENELPTIEKVKDVVFKLEAAFPEINGAVGTAAKDIAAANELIGKVQARIPEVAKIAEEGKQLTQGVSQYIDKGTEAVEAIAPNIKQDLLLLQQAAIYTEQLTGMLLGSDFDPNKAKASLDAASRRLATAVDVTDKTIALFEKLNALTSGNRLSPAIARLQSVKDRFQRQLTVVNKLQDALAKGEKPAEELVNELNRLSKETSGELGDIINRYDSEILPAVLQGLTAAKKSLATAQSVLAEAGSSMPDVKRIADDAAKGIAVGSKEFEAIRQELPAVEAKITQLADRFRAFETEGDIKQIIDLLKNNFEKESEFFAEPVLLKENKLFPIPNYGSGMSPFFSTLSLWVGALLLVSLLTVEVHDHAAGFRSYHIYFGRFFTFLTLSLLQSLLVTTGDIYLLGTYVAEKLPFVLFGLFIGSVFMLIVYTLVSVFGNVGKALAIVLLVLQLAGSGGTFPIQVTPPFFQAIHPFLPFTYAISMMREAVGGILWDIVVRDMIMLAVFAGIALVIGLALKKVINRASASFVSKAKESGLIH